MSGKAKQNTIKATVISDEHGGTVFSGVYRPGRMHDTPAVRSHGINDLLHAYPQVKVLVDAGYQGLARHYPGQSTHPR